MEQNAEMKAPMQPKTMGDIPDEIINSIFELVVVQRSPSTGGQIPIKVTHDLRNVAGVILPAARTCTMFKLITPMFLGLNIFELVQRTVRLGFPGRKNMQHNDLGGLKLLKSSWTWACDDAWKFQHSIYLPPNQYLHLIKSVTVRINILSNIVVGNPTPEQREELEGKRCSWLWIIERLAAGVLPNLDSLSLDIHASKQHMYVQEDKAKKNRELARAVIKEFVEARVPEIGAKKAMVKYVGAWTEDRVRATSEQL